MEGETTLIEEGLESICPSVGEPPGRDDERRDNHIEDNQHRNVNYIDKDLHVSLDAVPEAGSLTGVPVFPEEALVPGELEVFCF
jgi:hypothetical protein